MLEDVSHGKTFAKDHTRGARAARRAAPLLALLLGACRGAPAGEGAGVPAASAATGATTTAAQAEGAATSATKISSSQPSPAASGDAAHGWNDAQIAWQPFDEGIEKAKKDKKPVCLVLYTNWCPHCKNYSHVFEDAKVVARARDFVMIRVNSDENKEVSQKYAPDGGYVPRTFFLASDGTLDKEIRAPRDKYAYFYDERNPASILGAMETAFHKLVK